MLKEIANFLRGNYNMIGITTYRKYYIPILVFIFSLSGCAVVSAVYSLQDVLQYELRALEEFKAGKCKEGLAYLTTSNELKLKSMIGLTEYTSGKTLTAQEKNEINKKSISEITATSNQFNPIPTNQIYAGRCYAREGRLDEAAQAYKNVIEIGNMWGKVGRAYFWSIATIDGDFSKIMLDRFSLPPTKEDWRNVILLQTKMNISYDNLTTYLSTVKSPELFQQINLDTAIRYAGFTPEQEKLAWKVFTQRYTPKNEEEAGKVLLSKISQISELAKLSNRFSNLLELSKENTNTASSVLSQGDIFIDFTIIDKQIAISAFDKNSVKVLKVVDAPNISAHINSYRMLISSLSYKDLRALRKDIFNPQSSYDVWFDAGFWWVGSLDQKPSSALSIEVNDYEKIRLSALDIHGKWLIKTLLEPISKEVTTSNKIILAPDNVMATLPWAELLTRFNYIKPSTPVVLSHSLGVYKTLHDRGSLLSERFAKIKNPDSLVIANPLYDPSRNTNERTSARIAVVTESVGVAVSEIKIPPNATYEDALERMQKLVWSNLKGAELEGKEVSLMLGAQLLTGAQASKQNVVSNLMGEKQYRYLHFATHGYLDNKFPSYSSIVLGRTGQTRETDGYLTAWEILKLKINTELVVLSACDTGTAVTTDSDGVMGLPYSLYLAGAGKTLVTLWPVNDAATREFMNRFWRMKSLEIDTAQALANVQDQFKKGNAGQAYRDPIYWAPFVLYGSLQN